MEPSEFERRRAALAVGKALHSSPEFRIASTIQVHALRRIGEGIQAASVEVNVESAGPLERVDLVLP